MISGGGVCRSRRRAAISGGGLYRSGRRAVSLFRVMSALQHGFQDGGEAAEGLLEPAGVGIVIRRGGVGAAQLGGDGVTAADPQAIGPVMDPQL